MPPLVCEPVSPVLCGDPGVVQIVPQVLSQAVLFPICITTVVVCPVSSILGGLGKGGTKVGQVPHRGHPHCAGGTDLAR